MPAHRPRRKSLSSSLIDNCVQANIMAATADDEEDPAESPDGIEEERRRRGVTPETETGNGRRK